MKHNQGTSNVISIVHKVEREKNYPCLHNALGYILQLLRENGIGAERKRAAVIVPDIYGVQSPGCGKQELLAATALKLSYMQFSSTMVNIFVLGVLMSTKIYKFTDHPHLLNIPMLNLDKKKHSGVISDHSEGKVVSIVETSSPFWHFSIIF